MIPPELIAAYESRHRQGKDEEDHRNVADQLYAAYAKGRDLRRLEAIVGETGLSEMDKKFLRFAEEFENKFISQRYTDRI